MDFLFLLFNQKANVLQHVIVQNKVLYVMAGDMEINSTGFTTVLEVIEDGW